MYREDEDFRCDDLLMLGKGPAFIHQSPNNATICSTC
jgi:hypothetical protein